MQKRQKHAPQVEKAFVYLQEVIKTCRQEGNHHLPPTAQLAKDAHVSVVTMHRAIDLLKKKYPIKCSPRRGICIEDSCMDENQSIPKSASLQPKSSGKSFRTVPKWVTIKDLLIEDITKGAFPPGSPLPTTKELKLRYGTCSYTLRQALLSVVEDKKIHPYKRGYRVVTSPLIKKGGTIVLIAQHDLIHQLSSYSPFLNQLLTNLVQQQYSSGFTLKFAAAMCLLNPHKDDYITFKELESKYQVIGYIIITTSLSTKEKIGILDLCRSVCKPVALMDDAEFCCHPSFRSFFNLRVFSISNLSPTAGSDIGTFLFTRGHRNVAFFSLTPESEWSRARMQGISDSIATRTNRSAVRQFSSGAQRTWKSFVQTCKYSSIMEAFPGTSEESLFYKQQYINPFLRQFHQRNIMEEFFISALQHPEITAWVGANDECAILAYFFLRRNAVKIPDTIALAGFDNSAISYAYGITSYDFNAIAAGNAILQYIFSPAITRLRERQSIIEIPGRLVERESASTDRNI